MLVGENSSGTALALWETRDLAKLAPIAVLWVVLSQLLVQETMVARDRVTQMGMATVPLVIR